MKKLLFLLVGVLISAHSFSQNDSLKLIELSNQLNKINKENIELFKTSEKLEIRKQNLFEKLKVYIINLKSENKLKDKQITANKRNKQEAIKAENINEPIEEISIPDGVDSIRGSFFYRLFNKNKIILKPYKIVNNEKIYLD